MRSGTGGWTMGCNCDPGRPAPPICEVSGAGLPYRRFEPIADGHHGCLEYPRLDFTRVSHIHMPELHRPFG